MGYELVAMYLGGVVLGIFVGIKTLDSPKKLRVVLMTLGATLSILLTWAVFGGWHEII